MKNLLIKYKPQLLYTLFGTISTIIDIGVYQLCFAVFSISNIISNIIAWFVYVSFSFITNKIWVYGSRSMKPKIIIREGIAYYVGRGVSLVLGTGIMIFGVDYMKWNSFITKLVSDVFVIIINYAFGFLVFKRIEEEMKGFE